MPERKRKLRVVKGRVRNESPNEISPGGNHDRLRDTASCRCPARRCELPCCRGFGPGPELHQDRIRDLEDRPEYGRCQHHHAAELPALGEGSECRRRDHALRQAGSGRDRRVRRPQQLGGGGQGRGAPRHPGQGRLHPLALGYRAQPRRRADHEPPRLSAPRSHDQYRPGAGAGQEVVQCLVLARSALRHLHLVRGCADQDEGRGQDRRRCRHDRRLRPVRHRAVDGGPQRAQEGRLQPRLRQVLSGRHPGCAAAPQGRDGGQSRYLHRLQLPAGHPRRDGYREGAQLQSEGVLRRRRHGLPGLSSSASARMPTA